MPAGLKNLAQNSAPNHSTDHKGFCCQTLPTHTERQTHRRRDEYLWEVKSPHVICFFEPVLSGTVWKKYIWAIGPWPCVNVLIIKEHENCGSDILCVPSWRWMPPSTKTHKEEISPLNGIQRLNGRKGYLIKHLGIAKIISPVTRIVLCKRIHQKYLWNAW